MPRKVLRPAQLDFQPRTTVQTPMAEETMLVEIEAVAYIGD